MVPFALSLDYLPNRPHMKLYQHKSMFRINTDSCLLGEFIHFSPGSRVLDIGTNNGVLLLYASLHSPAFLKGIDINEQALEIAQTNLEMNGIKGELECIDAKEFNQKGFDVIIANPPYFANSLTNPNQFLSMARHEIYLPLRELISCASRNIKDDGHFFLVHLYTRQEEIKKVLADFGFSIICQVAICDIDKNVPNGLLIEASKVYNGETKYGEPIIVKR